MRAWNIIIRFLSLALLLVTSIVTGAAMGFLTGIAAPSSGVLSATLPVAAAGIMSGTGLVVVKIADDPSKFGVVDLRRAVIFACLFVSLFTMSFILLQDSGTERRKVQKENNTREVYTYLNRCEEKLIELNHLRKDVGQEKDIFLEPLTIGQVCVFLSTSKSANKTAISIQFNSRHSPPLASLEKAHYLYLLECSRKQVQLILENYRQHVTIGQVCPLLMKS